MIDTYGWTAAEFSANAPAIGVRVIECQGVRVDRGRNVPVPAFFVEYLRFGQPYRTSASTWRGEVEGWADIISASADGWCVSARPFAFRIDDVREREQARKDASGGRSNNPKAAA